MSSASNEWKPQLTTDELESRLENAYRRAMGAVRFNIDLDKCRLNTIKESASNAFEQGLNQTGPLFAKVGRGLIAAGSFQPGPGLCLKSIAGEILQEFFTEGRAAFAVQQASLNAEAAAWLKAEGRDEAGIRHALEAASGGLDMPDKDTFTREAKPFVEGGLGTMNSVGLGAVLGLVLGVVLTRAPHVGILGAAVGGGIGWYLGKNRLRARAERMVRHLPHVLHQSLVSQWNANTRRYADAINASR